MISIILSIFLAILSLTTVAPIVFPVFGLALGANAIIREKKQIHKRKSIIIFAIIGMVVNGIIVLIFILKQNNIPQT